MEVPFAVEGQDYVRHSPDSARMQSLFDAFNNVLFAAVNLTHKTLSISNRTFMD